MAAADFEAYPRWLPMKMLVGVVALTAICGVFTAPPSRGGGATSCPVTVRGSTRRPPAAFVRNGLPVPYVHKWRGSGGIWIRLPRHGVIPAQLDPNGQTISAKFPWWRARGGQLHAWARPVGQTEPLLDADVATVAEYGATGFVPSSLRFSEPGCWRITGSLRGHRLSFVARVVPGKP